MTIASTATSRYSSLSMVLHWLLAALIVGTFLCGWTMVDLPFSPRRLKLYNYHKWGGMTVLGLSALRLLWRLWRRPPPLPDAVKLAMPAWQRHAHHGTHALLYLLFFAVPLAGWAYSSAEGVPIVWLGLVPLPDWVPVDKALAEALKPVHRWLAYALATLTVVHVAAAIKHHWLDGDGLLVRMGWPRRG